MANIVKLKRSAVPGKVPTTTDLDLGELGINTYDGKVYLKQDSGTATIKELGAVTSVSGKTGAVALVKADVGLGNVDNTSDLNKPVSTATQTALDLKANLASPTFTGVPAAPTAALDTNTTQVATTAYVISAIADDAPTKTGGGASGTWGIDISGNAATATNLSSNRTFALTGDITGSVSSNLSSGASIATSIAAGAIVNADINASAAIADTKLATISTAGKVSGTAITSGNISTSGSIATTSTLAVGQSSAAANTDFDLAGTYAQTVVAVGALNIDCSTGNYFTKTISTNSTFTVSNVPASRAYSFTLELTHTSGTVTWFSGVEWPGGTAPTLTTGKTHLFMFVTDNGGTRWRASASVNYTN